jgi:chloride channel 3/4/5
MTIYLSSSESVYSTKDETAPTPTQFTAHALPPVTVNDSPSPHPSYGAFENESSRDRSCQPRSSPVAASARRRKVMYFAAGSGIPEIKTILSGK